MWSSVLRGLGSPARAAAVTVCAGLSYSGTATTTTSFFSRGEGSGPATMNRSSSAASSSGAESASAPGTGSGDTNKSSELQDKLMSACQRKDTAEVAMLLEAGGSLESLREVFGFSALHIAASEDASELARVVLEKSTTKSGDVDYMMRHDDVSISGFSDGKMTPIFLAVMKGNFKVARLLIDAGGNVNIGWEEKRSFSSSTTTPLAELSRNNYLEDTTAAAKLLLENGADPNLLGRFGESPLFKAIEYSRLDLVDLFLLHGADPNLRSGLDKKLPLVLARDSGKVEIVRSLLKAGASAV